MPRATAANDSDLVLGFGIRTEKNDLICFVKCKRRVGEGERMEGCENQVIGIGEEVFC